MLPSHQGHRNHLSTLFMSQKTPIPTGKNNYATLQSHCAQSHINPNLVTSLFPSDNLTQGPLRLETAATRLTPKPQASVLAAYWEGRASCPGA